jgi:pimeloyl-ACP methyl ester carboxylesterase
VSRHESSLDPAEPGLEVPCPTSAIRQPRLGWIGTTDDVILPAAQLAMAQHAQAYVVKVDASHLAIISHPAAVTRLIVAAAAASAEGTSYGGQIITALGTDTPNVVGLVHIAGFGLDEDDFVNHFAADVDPVRARVMFAVQQPLHWSALGEVMGVPAWKSLPSWFLIADGDQAIPPDAQRQFAPRMGATTVEVSTNHVAMVSHPDEVLQLIKTAAEAVPAAT